MQQTTTDLAALRTAALARLDASYPALCAEHGLELIDAEELIHSPGLTPAARTALSGFIQRYDAVFEAEDAASIADAAIAQAGG